MIVVVVYAVCGIAMSVCSALWFPWEHNGMPGQPASTGERVVGAFCQGCLWPLALLAWAFMGFRSRNDATPQTK